MSLIIFISSEGVISLSLMASLKIHFDRATHLIFILQFSWSISLINCCIVDFVSGWSFAKRILY